MKIYFERHPVGEIVEDGKEPPVFQYALEWINQHGAFPISTTMPIREHPHGWDLLGPWLLNLLPEDNDAIRQIARILDVPHTDVLGLLQQVGRDTSGAISFAERGATDLKVIPVESEDALERIINDLPKKPLLAGDDGVSMSLAGVQTKLAVRVLDNGQIAIPVDGAASSHILKPDSKNLWGSVHNEAFCMTLANLVGIPTPPVTTGIAGSRSYLLVGRYDRLDQGDVLRRLHQEDFCQALGLPPSAKYQHSQFRGPKGNFAMMADRLRQVAGAGEVLKLWDAMVLNILCCNTDAHMKNYSILIAGDGIELTPIYDVVCAAVWDGITRNFALDIGGIRDGDYLERRHWEREAKKCGLRPDGAVQRVEALSRAVLEQAEPARKMVEAMPAGGHALLGQIEEAVARRSQTILNGLDQ